MSDLLMRMPIPYEPKKKNRFIFRFPTPLGIQEWFVSSGARPKYTSEETEIQFLNTSTYVELELLDPTGSVIEKWILVGTMLNDVDFGDLDYGSSDVADISATLRFDRAIHVY